MAGIPLFAQLAGQLAERDFVVLRYDKRGVGKSGGRIERVTLDDYAEDAIAAVKWLAKRKDVDTGDASSSPATARVRRSRCSRRHAKRRSPGSC